MAVTGGDAGAGGPHPEDCPAAAREPGVPPERPSGFADAPAGVAAAKSAGTICVGVGTTRPAVALAAAGHVVADFMEVDAVPGPALRARGRQRS